MSFEQVKAYLAGLGLNALEFDVSSATVELAAVAVGCEPRRIAKTMSFLVDGAPVLIVLAGDAKVNNTKFKAAFHQKAKMLGHEQVAELTGFPVGGVCPFLAPEGVKVYLDESLKRCFPPPVPPTAPWRLRCPSWRQPRTPRAGWTCRRSWSNQV